MIVNCTIVNNSTLISPYTGGGGIACKYSSPMIVNCIISGNSSGRGGGIAGINSHPTIVNSIISDNSAMGKGGGLFLLYYSSSAISNCLIAGNKAAQGGGIHIDTSSPKLTNCTLTMNTKEAIRCVGKSNPVITNSIIWNNQRGIVTPRWGKSDRFQPNPVVSYSDVERGYTGIGNIDADPSFVNPGKGDFRLKADSPVIDKGSNEAPDLPRTDLAGGSRIVGAVVDMGAYEYQGDPSSRQ